MSTIPPEAGKSSFELLDQEAFFAALPLGEVHRALDLGCGAGRYTLSLAERLPAGASVHGVDLWPEGIAQLRRAAVERGLSLVTAVVGDVVHLTSVADGQVDLALAATVVHDLAARGQAGALLGEVSRVLAPGGCLAVVEFKKADTRPGPPLAIRLSPEDLAALVEPSGFQQARLVDLGPSLYLALYRRGPR